MSIAEDLRTRYAGARARLQTPVNAVPDLGIDLKRKPAAIVIPIEPEVQVPDIAPEENNERLMLTSHIGGHF